MAEVSRLAKLLVTSSADTLTVGALREFLSALDRANEDEEIRVEFSPYEEGGFIFEGVIPE